MRDIPPGNVEHVGVDWNRTRLIKGHEEDTIRNLKDMLDKICGFHCISFHGQESTKVTTEEEKDDAIGRSY